jgi:hypothetical protein
VVTAIDSGKAAFADLGGDDIGVELGVFGRERCRIWFDCLRHLQMKLGRRRIGVERSVGGGLGDSG